MDDTQPTPGSGRRAEPGEGVRIIGAEEAAEAVERGDVAPRRGEDQPRYGDRPQRPPVGPRPVLRFPLDAGADATQIERSPGVAGGASASGRGQRFDPQHPTSDPAMPLATAPEPVAEADPSDVDPTLDEPVDEVLDLRADDDASAPTPGPVQLPHWSERTTGDVPKVITGHDEDNLDAWSSFSSSSPRWRDSDTETERDQADDFASLGRTEWQVGAMDDSRPTNDEIYSFGPDSDREEARTPAGEPDAAGDEDRPGSTRTRGLRRRRRPRRDPAADVHSPGTTDDPGPGPTGGDSGAGRNLPAAVLVGLALAALALLLFSLGPRYAMVIVVAVIAICAVEYFNAVRRAGYQPAVLLGLVATVAFPLAVYWKGIAAYPVLGVLLVVTGLLWHLVGADGESRVVESTGVTLLGVAWIGGLGSFAALMLTLPDGVGMFVAAIVATVAYDVGGFAIGRNAGTRPLSEASPNKTWEGLVGGMVAAVMVTLTVVWTVPGIAPFDTFSAALTVGLAAAAAAPLGDLCESLVKRDLGIKDMGSILPGHGGVLDRFDALLFVLPVVFYAALAFHLGPFGS